jgi:hypothetical protein
LEFAPHGHGRLGRVVNSRPLSIGTKEHAKAHRRDVLCPSPKIQKQAAFWYKNRPEGFSPIEGKFLRAFFKILQSDSATPHPCKVACGSRSSIELRFCRISVFEFKKMSFLQKHLGPQKTFFGAFIFNDFVLIVFLYLCLLPRAA